MFSLLGLRSKRLAHGSWQTKDSMELTLIILGSLFVGFLIIRDELKAKREKKRQERLNRIKFDWALIHFINPREAKLVRDGSGVKWANSVDGMCQISFARAPSHMAGWGATLLKPNNAGCLQATSRKLDKFASVGYYGTYESKRSKKNNRIDDQNKQDAGPKL